jgi:hypothetical protein
MSGSLQNVLEASTSGEIADDRTIQTIVGLNRAADRLSELHVQEEGKAEAGEFEQAQICMMP